MDLDNYPVRCECGKHAYRSGIPYGLTHRKSDPCLFKDDGLPTRICCWLRGEIAASELLALGEGALCDRMHVSMNAEEALSFGDELAAAALRLKARYAGQSYKPEGAPWLRLYEGETDADILMEEKSTFEEALASIRDAARWYEKVGRLGYEVHAWY